MGRVTSLVVVVGIVVVEGRTVVVVAMVVAEVRWMRVVGRPVVGGRVAGAVLLACVEVRVVAAKLHELAQKFHTTKQSD